MANGSDTEELGSPAWKFLVETITGMAIFLIIASAAVGLSYIVITLDNYGVDKIIIIGLKAIEYAIFFVDIVLFGRFLWRTSIKTWGEL